jgi:hypothetical protein
MKYVDVACSVWCAAGCYLAPEGSFLQGVALGLSVFFLMHACWGND